MEKELYFYYPDGTVIKTQKEFIDFYSKVYYWENRDIKLEKTIENLLSRQQELTESDFFDILCWKTGGTTSDNKSVKTRYNVISVSEITKKYNETKGKSKEEIFHELIKIKGIGPVYAITLLYFISKAEYPIYDNFADIALQAITDKDSWKNTYNDKTIYSWKNYEEYKKTIFEIFGDKEYQKNRKIDQALWAYGHLFNETNRNKKRIKSKL